MPEPKLLRMILNKKIVYTLCILAFAFSTQAQSGTIKGKIYNSDSTNVIAGVQISDLGNTIFSLSNSFGSFEIDLKKGDPPILLFLAKGYNPKTIQLGAAKDTFIHVFLEENINTLDPVLLMTKHSGSDNVTGSSAYIGPKELDRFAYSDANQVLRNVPGIQIQQEDGFGLRPNIGLRATGVERSAKITLMEDGILAAPAPYAAPAAYYFPSVARMEGVEVVKGSSQIKYGPFTTGGAINFISTPIPEDFSAKLSLNTGSYNTQNMLASLGHQGEYIGVMVQSLQQRSDGFKNLPSGLGTGFTKSDYLVKISLRNGIDPKVPQKITLKIGQTDEISNETYLGLNLQDYNADPYQRYAASQNDVMKSKQQQFSIHHQIKLAKHFTISTTGYYNTFHRNWYKLNHLTDSAGNKLSIGGILGDQGDPNLLSILKGSNSADETLWLKANNRTYYSKGVQMNANYKIPTKREFVHAFEWGIRVHQDQIDRFQWQDGYSMLDGFLSLQNKGIEGTESNRIETANAVASHLTYQFQTNRLEIKPGLRYENISQARQDFGKNDVNRTGASLTERKNDIAVLIPGIGVYYDLRKGKSLFAGMHKGFSPAGSAEGASPEISTNYELGYMVQSALLTGQAVAFYSNYQNLLGSDLNASGGSGTGDLFNGGAALSYGLEISATTTKLLSKSKQFTLPITISYTFTEAQFKSSFNSSFEGWGNVLENDHLPYFAPHQAFVNASLEHAKFAFNVSTKYTDAMRTRPGQNEISSDEKIPASYFMDLNFAYHIHPRIKLKASVLNALNNTNQVSSRPFGLRPAMPRMLRFGLTASL